jgi:hypothetical protein
MEGIDWLFDEDDLIDLFGDCELMASVQAYLDESGTHHTSPITVVAGAVGHKSAWLSIDVQWRAVLDKSKVGEFHATDLNSAQGEFVGWDEPKRRALTSLLLKVITNENIIPTGVAVSNDVFALASREFPDLPITAYQFCCEWVIMKITHTVPMRIRNKPVHHT